MKPIVLDDVKSLAVRCSDLVTLVLSKWTVYPKVNFSANNFNPLTIFLARSEPETLFTKN